MKVYKLEELTQSNKTIYISKCKVLKDEPEHTHDFIEIVYILSGDMTQIIDGHSYSVSRGDMLFMNYSCTHSFKMGNDPNTSYINILFSPETISENITPSNAFSLLALTSFNAIANESDYGKITFIGFERKTVESIVLSMHTEFKEKNHGWENVIKNYFNILLTYMLRKSNAVMERGELDGTWSELFDYIDGNLETKLTLSLLAQKCFYNPSYFSRIFKEKFGITLMEYVTRKRLERAKEMLEKTDISVEKIAIDVGFSDRNSFYHSFSRRYGIAPQQFRKSNKK